MALHVLSLGAGVQSTAVYLLACEGKLHVDFAVMADTKEEPASVYRHLDWLKGLGGPPILVRGRGRSLGDNLRLGRDWRKGHTSIPAFTLDPEGRQGMIRRACTGDFKIEVVEQTIRRELLGLKPRQRAPRGAVVQLFGISTDEAARAERARRQFAKKTWCAPAYPLLDLGWSRRDCVEYLKTRVPHETPKSACVCCPYKSNASWADLKANDPEGWARAVEIDRSLRDYWSACTRGMRGEMFLHNSRIPLETVDFATLAPQTLDPMTTGECTGMCGN